MDRRQSRRRTRLNFRMFFGVWIALYITFIDRGSIQPALLGRQPTVVEELVLLPALWGAVGGLVWIATAAVQTIRRHRHRPS